MPLLQNFLWTFLDTLTGHIALVAYLLAVTDEQAVWKRLKKIPPMFLSPLIATLLSFGLYFVPELGTLRYFIASLTVLMMCTFWVRWAWQFSFWRAFAATCMAGIFQVADAILTMTLFWLLPLNYTAQFAVSAGVHLGVSIIVALLLYKLRFGKWFRLLLDHEPVLWKTALLLFALEATMEVFLRLVTGIQPQFLLFCYLLVTVMAALMTGLIIYLARQFDAARKIQAQQDVIAQQQLYEQDLEAIRQEVRMFRHDYKNLLAGLSRQADAGELEQLRAALSELDAGFDQRLGEKIQASTQIGNLQIPQVRSLLLSKLTAMRERNVECRLEVLYPICAVSMDPWDFVRCLGILIDNAVEAVEGTERSYVEIVLLAQGNRVDLRISNPWRGEADPACFWEDGWSTKGKGRGLGLSSYLRILARYPNASPCTSWADGMFVQELTIGGTA